MPNSTELIILIYTNFYFKVLQTKKNSCYLTQQVAGVYISRMINIYLGNTARTEQPK